MARSDEPREAGTDAGAAMGGVGNARAFLRALPLFQELAPGDVDRLCRMARRLPVAAGGTVMEEGTPGDGLYVVVEGQLEVSTREGGREVVLGLRGPGDFLGEMSLLEQVPRTATVRALGPAELMIIGPDDFQSLIAASPQAAATILRVMARRLRSTEASLMQQEKLASLGTLAAGLAHELNNPAAALRRAADHLRAALAALDEATTALGSLTPTPAQAGTLDTLRRAVAGEATPIADPSASSLEEQRLGEWLDARGLEEPWEAAATLAAYGFDAGRVEALAEQFDGRSLGAVLGWLHRVLAVRALQEEIGASARAISEIVGAVRSYAYLDQAPVQEVDLRESLENTLVILRHRLKEGIAVERDFDPELPRVEAYGSELNQVWTNLIANAIDAMEGKGTLRLATRRSGEHAVVEVTDSGPGVPAELRSRIFDVFFTTKPPGAGTGLGLYIARNIVVDRHRGRIAVDSQPGRTTFTVHLPFRLSREPS